VQPLALALALALTPTSWHTIVDHRIPDPEEHVTVFDGVTFGEQDLRLSVQVQTTGRPDKPDWDLIRQGFSGKTDTLFKVEYMPDGRVICDFTGTEGKAQAYGGPSLDDGRWHWVTCTKTTDAVTLAVDGREVARDDEAIGELPDGGDIIVGAHNAEGTSERFEGLIQRVHIATSGASRENSR
jgi:hypothetical protein